MKDIQMIFGAPGCGKTTYLIELLRELLRENDPDKIAFVSFTKKGSYEGRDRAIKEFGLKEKDFPYFRTIHSIAFRELGMSKYEMMSKRHYKDFSRAMGMNFVGYYTEDFINNDDKYLFQVSLSKNNPTLAERAKEDLDEGKYGYVDRNYSRYKTEMGVRDFDDLLVDFIQLDKPLNVELAVIDEAQDLTTLQWEFCKVAFRNCKKVYIAGDDDQAIYEWSGADLNQFLALTKHSSVYILDKSYRLKQSILDFSKKITARITNRVEKKFEPFSKEEGSISFYNRLSDVPVVSEQSYYFLSRNNYYLDEYKNFIMKMGIPFNYKGKPMINKVVYEAIKKYENYRQHNPQMIGGALQTFLRKDITLPYPPWYDAFELPLVEISYFRDIFKNKTNVDKTYVDINTIHGVKGGEADNVIVRLDMTRNVNRAIENSSNIDSELRVLYVAMTRAKKHLHIVYSSTKYGYDEIIEQLRR